MPLISIGYYDDSVTRGGTTRYLLNLIRGLDRTRFAPAFFAPEARDWHSDLRELNVEVITLPPFREAAATPEQPNDRAREGDTQSGTQGRRRAPPQLALSMGLAREVSRLRRLFRQKPVALMHSNNAGAEAAPIAMRWAGVPRVMATWHVDSSYDLFGERQSLFYRTLENVSMRSLHYAISVCDATRNNWIRRCDLGGEYQSRISVIHNGIDPGQWLPQRSRAEAKTALGLSEHVPIIGSLGRLDHAKGYRYVIEALPRVVRHFPDARLILAGKGPLEDELRQLAQTLGVAGNVNFLGFTPNVKGVLEALDVYVQPSLCEAHSFALLEASAAGTAIVASDVGGNPETVKNGDTGLIVPPADAEALASALVTLLGNPERRAEMGRNAIARVNEYFTVELMCRKTVALYERALAG